MESITLEEIVRTYIQLDPPNSKGWFPVLCKVCMDHGKKGKRAAFLFSAGATSYHCFNCGHSSGYDPVKHDGIPNKMMEVLTSFEIPQDQLDKVIFTSLVHKMKGERGKTILTPKLNIEPAIIPTPKHFYLLAEARPDDKWAEIANAYLDARGIDPTTYPFMLAPKTGVTLLDRWFKRIIIPIYKDSNLIYYLGRDLTSKAQKKYLYPDFSKENVIYGFNRIFEKVQTPLYIVEGWFDAYAIDGVAILGNEISQAHIAWLNKSYREKVYIPDRTGNGKQTALRALELGWSVATPGLNTWGDDIKDMNDAVIKYGRMYVMKSLAETTAKGFTAKTNLGFYCKYEKPNKNRSNKKDPSTS